MLSGVGPVARDRTQSKHPYEFHYARLGNNGSPPNSEEV